MPGIGKVAKVITECVNGSSKRLGTVAKETAAAVNKKAGQAVTSAVDSAAGKSTERLAANVDCTAWQAAKGVTPKSSTAGRTAQKATSAADKNAGKVSSAVDKKAGQAAKEVAPAEKDLAQIKLQKEIDTLWEKHGKELDELFNEPRAWIESVYNCRTIEATAKERLLASIKDVKSPSKYKIIPNKTKLYHGTNIENVASIKANGFDLSKCKRTEVGKGVYFGFDREAIKAGYGDGGIIEAVFTGTGKIAKVDPGVYSTVADNTMLQLNIAGELGIPLNGSEKIVKGIIEKYYSNLLKNQNIQGLFAEGSYKAGIEYLMVPNPANIKIL